MQFPQALETVLEALERMRDQNARHPSASRATLARLKDAKAVAVIADTPRTPVRLEPTEANRPCLESQKIELSQQDTATKSNQLSAINKRVCTCVKCPNLASSPDPNSFWHRQS